MTADTTTTASAAGSRAERMAEIEARTNAATDGPWIRSGVRQRFDEPSCITVGPDGALLFATSIGYRGKDQAAAIKDSNFIAHARSDIPWLLTELRAAQTKLADMTDDYLRRHKDACNYWLENQRMRAVVDAARDFCAKGRSSSMAVLIRAIAALDTTEGKQTP